MPRSSPDFLGILRVLHGHNVRSIVVGGVCATLHGAPVATFDLDLVHARDEQDLDRLITALDELGAVYRLRGEQKLSPQRDGLRGDGHHLLMTTHGPLDLLGVIGRGRDFSSLLPQCARVDIGGFIVNVLPLALLIQTKREAGRARDLAVLPILERTLAERHGA
ncbi:hypothetical protein JXA88_06650 [Candidatus Fermentibacteria bacterium]|nr:hypothetical protein [Candidatus Fermentibacteria bacterium]